MSALNQAISPALPFPCCRDGVRRNMMLKMSPYWVVLLLVFAIDRGASGDDPVSKFDGDRAYAVLKQLCDIGPRPSGSAGMERQQTLLTAHFTRLGGKVRMQAFDVRHPEDGSRVTMRNLIVEWHPERRRRILLCAHYDTRPFPDNDPVRPKGRFVGANDGASGTAVLAELGRHMPQLDGDWGVDFVLFDGEEFVFDKQRDKDRFFMGSIYFARDYVANRPSYRYRWGILLDMVGDAQLQLYKERISMRYARRLVEDVWRTAERLGVREFNPRVRAGDVRDDHVPLNQIARIPTIDIIDFDYPAPRRPSYWHTEADLPDKCSAESLGKVGWVVLEWLRGLR